MNMFINQGWCIIGKCVVFSSLKILDPKKQDVASLTVLPEGEDTEGEIPADGKCITLLLFVQVLIFNK